MKTRTFVMIVAVLVLSATVLVAVGLQVQTGAEASTADPEYLARVFPEGEVIAVDIQIAEADWQALLADPTAEQYYDATVVIAGETVHHVGFRVKGNSSLSSVANSESERYSFKIDFDQFVTGQSLYGLTKLNLNNNFSDASSMREYLGYQAFAKLGVAVPATAYANISINGELWGFYLAVEGIESPFLERYYGSVGGELYKPEGTGADLAWRGEDPDEYPGIIDQNKNVQTNNQQLIELLRAIDSGENLEQYLDVDAALRYFAVSTALCNFDSYQGQMLHNYYLYNNAGQFVILPWDLNMAFGGFGGSSGVLIDEPTMGALADRPLIEALLSVPEYRERYHSYLKTMATEFLSEENMELAVQQLNELIRPYVAADPSKFYTLEQYDLGLTGASGLIAFSSQIADSILAQLSGAAPSTNNGEGMSTGGGFGGRPNGGAVGAGDEGGVPAGGGFGAIGGVNPPDIGTGNPPAEGGGDAPIAPDGNPPAIGGNPPAMGGNLPAQGAGNPGGVGGFSLPDGVDMETLAPLMREAMSGTLSAESKAKLLELGFTEEQIAEFTSRGQFGDNGEAGKMPPGMGQGVESSLLERSGWLLLGGLAVCMLATVIFVLRFRRRRFVS